MPTKRQQTIAAAWGLLLAVLFVVLIINILIYRGIGGTTLVRTLSGDAEWAIVAVGLYAVIVELRKPPGPELSGTTKDRTKDYDYVW